MELAIATSILAHRGEKPDPHFILKITDELGRTLYSYEPTPNQAISASAANDAYKAMESNQAGVSQITTTGSKRDAWAIQVVDDIVTIIWLGFDDPKKIGEAKVIEKSIKQMLGEFNAS
jgi:penicillin-binding protein 1A